jgi:polysaccharide deacetylase 2 family uncharacterized protein YibQ
MSSRKRRIKRRRIKRRKHYHILLILCLVLIGTFFIYNEFSKEDFRIAKSSKKTQQEGIKRGDKGYALPKLAIVIDDLGTSKKAAQRVFSLDASVTLSILPQESYTAWVAQEGQRRGYEVIGHMPLEAKASLKLGKGGLYTWMTNTEIRKTLQENINSIPYIKGVSSHMGSAFTEDVRAMSALTSELRAQRLFFLDSFTTPHSVGTRLCNEKGVKVIKRDIFLDHEDEPDYLRAQWEKAVKIARKRGYSIVLAHPKESTIAFLREAVVKNDVTD